MGKQMSVLIADSSEEFCAQLKDKLQALGYAVMPTAADGQQALEFLRRGGEYAQAPRPDLVLLDLNMPRMSGHEVLREIKDDDDLKSIPIVVLTTSSAAPDITASYARHANAYVSKPMDLDSFEAAVRQINHFYSEIAILPE